MGFFSGLMGHASEVDAERLESDFVRILADGEQIEKAYQVVRDLIVFTNRRLILVNKQGVTGKKVEYHSIPYRSVTHFLVETAGHFELDAELKIWISGNSEPLIKEFRKDKSIFDIQKALADHILR